MTLVKFNQKPVERRLNSLFDEFFSDVPSKFFQNEPMVFGRMVPVNILEKEMQYQIQIQAPGFDKADFKINMDHNTLTVSAEKKTENTTETEKFVKREFSAKSFSRSFELDENVLHENITAKYENGVLHLSIPKKEKNKIQTKEISIQ